MPEVQIFNILVLIALLIVAFGVYTGLKEDKREVYSD